MPGEPCLPFADLLEFSGCETVQAFATRYGFALRDARLWENQGVPMGVADTFCPLSLGVHASAVWPEQWYSLADW